MSVRPCTCRIWGGGSVCPRHGVIYDRSDSPPVILGHINIDPDAAPEVKEAVMEMIRHVYNNMELKP